MPYDSKSGNVFDVLALPLTIKRRREVTKASTNSVSAVSVIFFVLVFTMFDDADMAVWNLQGVPLQCEPALMGQDVNLSSMISVEND